MRIPQPVVKWLKEFSCSHRVTLVSKRLLHQKHHWDCFGYQQIAAVLQVIIEGEAKKKMNIDIKKSDITRKMIYLYIFHVFHDRLFHKSVLVSVFSFVKEKKKMYVYILQHPPHVAFSYCKNLLMWQMNVYNGDTSCIYYIKIAVEKRNTCEVLPSFFCSLAVLFSF